MQKQLTAINLSRRQNNHAQIRPRALARNIIADKACHRSSKQHRDNLNAQHRLSSRFQSATIPTPTTSNIKHVLETKKKKTKIKKKKKIPKTTPPNTPTP
jgi:hypothetical protein